MEKDEYYVDRLEQMILNQLLPVYRQFYYNQGMTPPELDCEVLQTLKKQKPALFRSWPLD